MTDQPPPQHRRRLPQISLTAWVVIAVFAVGSLAGAAIGIYNAGPERVLVAQHDLPAFHVISMKDVKLKKVARSAVPDGALRSLSAARNHYTLQSIDDGNVLVKSNTGPKSASAGTVVIPLPVRHDSLDGIQAGALVDLLLAPTGASGHPLVISKIEVVEEKKAASGDQVVFVAVSPSCESAIAQIAGRGQAILARLTGKNATAG